MDDTAQLISPTFSLTAPACLTFAYHMRGIHIGDLTVFARNAGGASVVANVLTRTGDQGSTYLRVVLVHVCLHLRV